MTAGTQNEHLCAIALVDERSRGRPGYRRRTEPRWPLVSEDFARSRFEDLARVYKFDLAAPLAALRHHNATLKALAPQSIVKFDASFAPRLEYYTGIVFEMLSEDGTVLASGGQYDRLLQRLGASVPVTAAGCAVWVDRVEAEMTTP